MSGLERLERDFQGFVYERDPAYAAMAALVASTAKVSAVQRLDVYADAYRLRLLEVLGNDFPGLKQLAGEEKFEQLARAYIEAQPSAHFNIRWYGEGLSHFLRLTSPWCDDAALAEMAAFEWAMGLAFDAPDEACVTLEEIAAIPPAAWPGMVPVLQSGLQNLRLAWNVPAIRQAADQGGILPALECGDTPRHWLIWRQDLTVYFRPMEPEEAWAIESLRDWASFAEICEGLCRWHEPGEVAAHAAGLLKRWVTDGVICEIQNTSAEN